ncbi:MAG: hypothetical protein ACI9UA_000230 [Pseudoalteromonas tetraodonis]
MLVKVADTHSLDWSLIFLIAGKGATCELVTKTSAGTQRLKLVKGDDAASIDIEKVFQKRPLLFGEGWQDAVE